MNLKERMINLARALCMTPIPERIDVSFSWIDGRRRWWLTGCIEGDQVLPRTGDCYTMEEAIEAAEAWLMPEICSLTEKKS